MDPDVSGKILKNLDEFAGIAVYVANIYSKIFLTGIVASPAVFGNNDIAVVLQSCKIQFTHFDNTPTLFFVFTQLLFLFATHSSLNDWKRQEIKKHISLNKREH